MGSSWLGLMRPLFPFVLIFAVAETGLAQEPEEICFLTIAKSTSSGHPERKNYVINDKSEWEALWAQVVSPGNPKPALPEIDFTRRTVIGVFQGTQPNPTFEVIITGMTQNQGKIDVFVKEHLGACVAPGIVANSFHLVEVERLVTDAVEFTIKQKVRKCP